MLSIRKNLAYNFLLSASQVLLPLISIPYVSRVLSPEGIGKVSFIDSFTYYFICIAEFGIALYGIREVAKLRNKQEERDKLVSELLSLHLLSSLVTMALYAILITILWQKVQDPRLVWFSISFLLVNSFTCEWYFKGMERFRYITLRSLITRLLGLISIFLLVKQPEDYYLYYAIMVAAAIANLLWNNIVLFREVNLRFRDIRWKRHLQYTSVIYAISLVYSISLMLDNVLLRLVSTAAVVGIYAFAAKIVRMIAVLFTDTITVIFPRIIALQSEGSEAGMKELMQKNLQLLVFFTVPASVGIGLSAGPLVRLFLGAQFEEAIPCVQVLAAFPLLKSLNIFYCNQVLIAHHKEKLALWSLLTGNLAFIPLTLILSFEWQYMGAAIALLASELLVLLTAYGLASKHFPALRFSNPVTFLHAVLGSVLFVPVFGWLNQSALADWLILLMGVPLCALLYICAQFFVLRNAFALGLKQWVSSIVSRKQHHEQAP
ncbi:MAG: flippase [Chitinophagaceae bacterium]|nr:flippase [Chitinophagaceae bacterium]